MNIGFLSLTKPATCLFLLLTNPSILSSSRKSQDVLMASYIWDSIKKRPITQIGRLERSIVNIQEFPSQNEGLIYEEELCRKGVDA